MEVGLRQKMSPTIPIALFGWLVLTPLLFMMLPQRRAALVSVIGGSLFLPMASISLGWGPPLQKVSAVGIGLALGLILFETRRVLSIRWGFVDLLMLVWVMVPGMSVLANGLGITFVFSSSLGNLLTYGIPYLAGRLLFRDAAAAKDLAVGIVAGGLLYVPLCWLEIRLSPQLHSWVYGFHQHSFLQSFIDGGWRPTVFMQHGRMVATWMMSSALVAVWLWMGGVKIVWRVPIRIVVIALGATLLFLKSMGAILLFMTGAVLFALTRVLRTPVLVAMIALVPAVYLTARIGLRWNGSQLVEMSRPLSPERADSLLFRINSEEVLIGRALERPLLGWGGNARNLILDEEGKNTTVTDSLWISTMGVRGLVGLGCLYGWLTIPAAVVAWRCRRYGMDRSLQHIMLGLCSVSIFFAIDSLFNAMVNQVFILLCGAMVSLSGLLKNGPAIRSTARVWYARTRPLGTDEQLPSLQ